MFQAFVIGVAGSLVAAIIVAVYPYRHNLLGSLRCYLFHRQNPVRVSMAALLRIQSQDKFLLIRNHYRPEMFGPLGGVFKYYEDAKEILDGLCFSVQTREPNEDLRTDLRGLIPGKSIPHFIRWFMSGRHREVEPLTRELTEELIEIGIDRNTPNAGFKFDLVRTVYEGPTRVPGVAYLQLRFFQIYQFARDCEAGKELTADLFAQVTTSPHLIAVTSEEIRRRRANTGHAIGDHAYYLLGKVRARAEPAPYPW